MPYNIATLAEEMQTYDDEYYAAEEAQSDMIPSNNYIKTGVANLY